MLRYSNSFIVTEVVSELLEVVTWLLICCVGFMVVDMVDVAVTEVTEFNWVVGVIAEVGFACMVVVIVWLKKVVAVELEGAVEVNIVLFCVNKGVVFEKFKNGFADVEVVDGDVEDCDVV